MKNLLVAHYQIGMNHTGSISKQVLSSIFEDRTAFLLSFLTTIRDEGVIFTWFLNLTGIFALLIWVSVVMILIYWLQGRVEGLAL